MASHTLRLSPETPTPNLAPRGGELFWARFFGAKAPKNRAVQFPPSPREGGRGMGLPTKPAKQLCKAVLRTQRNSTPIRVPSHPCFFIKWLFSQDMTYVFTTIESTTTKTTPHCTAADRGRAPRRVRQQQFVCWFCRGHDTVATRPGQPGHWRVGTAGRRK